MREENRLELIARTGNLMMQTLQLAPTNLSPSCRAILELLSSLGPMTPTEITKMVSFSSRTVRQALKNLLSQDLVRKMSVLTDARRRIYQTNLW